MIKRTSNLTHIKIFYLFIYLFTYGIFNDAVSNPGYIELNDKMNNESRNGYCNTI
jgi:hypothetical protein